MPDNTSTILHFLRDPFDPISRPLERRRRSAPLIINQNQNETTDSIRNGTEIIDHYEKYDVEAVQIGNGLTNNDGDAHYSDEWNGMEEDEEYSPADYRITKQNDFTTARWTLYKGIEAMADRLSYQ